MLRRRQTWFETQPDLDPEKLVFIDETGAFTKMARRCGRAARAHRCRAPVPHEHWKTTIFVGVLRLWVIGLTQQPPTVWRRQAAALARLWDGEAVAPARRVRAPLFRDFVTRHHERRSSL